MPDDVDDLLRRAMATLDRQAPAGYFDTLAGRALARLDGDALDDFIAEEEVTDAEVIGEREEHSGLQDIRNLASETKARLARRTSQEIAREDLLASSSAGWKAVALPDPARHSAAIAAERPSGEGAAGATATTAARATDELAQPRAARAAAQVGTSDRAAAATPIARRRRMLATVGLGVAAAAGAMIVVSTRGNDSAERAAPAMTASSQASPGSPPPTAVARDEAVPSPPSAAPPAPTSTAPAAVAPVAATVAKSAPVKGGQVIGKDRPVGKTASGSKHAGKRASDDIDPDAGRAAPPSGASPKSAPNAAPQAAGSGATGSGSDEPSFDELVKQAGVAPAKPAAPRLDRKALSADDIKRAMTAVTASAKACFTGTEGLATVRLTVAPSGKVTKVTTSGPFAGTPTAACVERAVKSAMFPPWDGGPQSFGYSYLLSE